MTIRKLILLDNETQCLTEIDPIKLRRVALKFREWLLTVDSDNDPFGFLQHDMPLVEAALNGTVSLPYKGRVPPARGSAPAAVQRTYTQVSAPFYKALRGALSETPQIIEKDFRRYAWTEFELPKNGPR